MQMRIGWFQILLFETVGARAIFANKMKIPPSKASKGGAGLGASGGAMRA